MPSNDPRIDAYIAKSAPFARPILEHLRAIVHRAVPQTEETLKWGLPHFMAHGAILCAMASFKEHCAFGFWKASLLPDPKKILRIGDTSMGHLGRIQSLKDLPSATVLSPYLRKAAELNRLGTTARRVYKPRPKAVRTPTRLAKTLTKSAKARGTYEALSPSQKREYIEWLAEAKSPETRARRLATAIEWLSQGKPRNWKYMKDWRRK